MSGTRNLIVSGSELCLLIFTVFYYFFHSTYTVLHPLSPSLEEYEQVYNVQTCFEVYESLQVIMYKLV